MRSKVKDQRVSTVYSSSREHISELRRVTCHWDHIITQCYLS